jgi:hypothetical protein
MELQLWCQSVMGNPEPAALHLHNNESTAKP